MLSAKEDRDLKFREKQSSDMILDIFNMKTVLEECLQSVSCCSECSSMHKRLCQKIEVKALQLHFNSLSRRSREQVIILSIY